MLNFKNKKRKKGFTLVESILIFAVALIIIGILFITYSTVMARIRVNKEVSFINLLRTNVINMYTSSPSYSTLTPTFLISNNVIEKDQIIDSATIKDYLGTAFNVAPYYNGVGFTFTITGMTSADCANFLSKVSKNFTLVNDTNNASEVTPSNAINYCSKSTLNLIQTNIQAPTFTTNIPTNRINIATYPTKNAVNGNSITANNTILFQLTNNIDSYYIEISESNKNNVLISYLTSKMGLSGTDGIKTSSTSSGYSETGCGSGIVTGGNLGNCNSSQTVDSLLNALASVPSDVIAASQANGGFTITYSVDPGSSQTNVSKICNSGAFTCKAATTNSSGVVTSYTITLGSTT